MDTRKQLKGAELKAQAFPEDLLRQAEEAGKALNAQAEEATRAMLAQLEGETK